MDNLDMDISNYNFEDLLDLFHLHADFTGQELKSAKTIVYKVHPDKSGLDKSYFLFFSKAYKMLYKIHKFREGSSKELSDYDEYTIISKGENTSNRKILEQHKEYAEIKTNPRAFNSWFNELFEKNNEGKQDDGYGTWLSSEMENVQQAKNPTEMAELIEERKKKARDEQLTVYKSFEPIQSTHGDNLIKKEGPVHYQSGLFSKLQFDDLKDAHENSVIPITNEDYKNRKTFRNIDEMNRHRKMDEVSANELLKDHNTILKNMENEEKAEGIDRFYDLMKQEEAQKTRNQTTWSQLKRLK
jgi:hypothetical protein